MAAGSSFYLSHDLGRLAGRLYENLSEEAEAEGDPFVPARILVPNRNIKRWLLMRLADTSQNPHGAVANLDFSFVEKGLAQLLASIDPAEDPGRLMQKRDSLLCLLAGISTGASQFNQHVSAVPGESPAGRDLRAFQFASRAASLFQEYEYHRPEWIDHWRSCGKSRPAGLPRGRDAVHDTQRKMYELAYGTDNAASPAHVPGFLSRLSGPVHVFAAHSRRVLSKPRRLKSARPVHIFGLSQISRFHVSLFEELSRFFPIRFYFLNLFPEINPGQSGFMTLKRPPFASPDDTDFSGPAVRAAPHPLLSVWSTPARHTMALLSNWKRKSRWFVDGFTAGTGGTVLEALQKDISSGGKAVHYPAVADRSLQIAGCPSIKRELQTVHQSILANIADDPSMLLTDIAVLVTDMRRYRPVIESVFDDGQRLVPFNLTDFSAGDESSYADGMQSLFDLVGSRFTRADLFRLFFNPCFLSRSALTRSDVMCWLEWAERLNVYRGFERVPEESGPDGRAFDGRLYTWSLASLRLRLGRIMESDEDFAGAVPYRDMASEDNDLLGAFCSALEDLHEFIAKFESADLDAEQLCRTAADTLDRFLSIPADRPEEDTVRESVKETLAWLSRSCSDLSYALTFPILRSFLLGAAGGIPASRGNFLSGGVSISEMQPMRPIPFKIVYLCGMGEGLFPGRPDVSIFNLRTDAPRTGDAQVPDGNRLLFIENILSVRQKIYMTYVSCDLQKDRTIEPSSVIRELRTFLNGRGVDVPVTQIPLSAHDERLFLSQAAVSDLLVSFSELDMLTALALRRGKEGEIARAKILHGRRFSIAGQTPQAESLMRKTVVTIEDLRAFLIRPFDAVMKRRRLEESGEEDERAFADSEPVVSRYPADYEIPAHALESAVFDPEWTPEKTHQCVALLYERAKKMGTVPRGSFGRADAARAAAFVTTIAEGMKAASGGRPVKRLRFWDGTADPGQSVNLPPHIFEIPSAPGDTVSVTLQSRGEYMFDGGYILWTKSSHRSTADCVRPFIVHAALSCHPEADPAWFKDTVTIHTIGPGHHAAWTVPPLNPLAAQAWLLQLLSDYLSGDDSFLPLALLERAGYRDLADVVADAGFKQRYAEHMAAAFADSFTPLTYSSMADVISARFPDDIFERARRRWKFLIDNTEQVHARAAQKKHR